MDSAPHIDANRQLVIELYVRDLGRSISFYEALGFKLGRREERFAQLSWEAHEILLEEQEGLPVPFMSAGNVRVLVPDVDLYWRRALELGVSVVRPVQDRYYGLRDFTILDPDGFGVRFATPLRANEIGPISP